MPSIYVSLYFPIPSHEKYTLKSCVFNSNEIPSLHRWRLFSDDFYQLKYIIELIVINKTGTSLFHFIIVTQFNNILIFVRAGCLLLWRDSLIRHGATSKSTRGKSTMLFDLLLCACKMTEAMRWVNFITQVKKNIFFDCCNVHVSYIDMFSEGSVLKAP